MLVDTLQTAVDALCNVKELHSSELDGTCELALQEESTPLHMADRYGHNESVQLLLATKGNANAMDMLKDTPLHKAARDGHSGTVQLLLAAEGNPNAENIFSDLSTTIESNDTT